jgi:hypothetical protein
MYITNTMIAFSQKNPHPDQTPFFTNRKNEKTNTVDLVPQYRRNFAKLSSDAQSVTATKAVELSPVPPKK